MNSNPALDFSSAPSYRKYGFETAVVGEFREGAPIAYTFYHLEDGPFSIENYYLNVQAHETALREAGFREVRWHGPQLAAEASTANNREHWTTLLQHPPFTFMECLT